MEGKRRCFLCKWLLENVTLYQEKRKAQKLKLLNQSVQSFSRIVTHALTSYVGKVVELEAQKPFGHVFINSFLILSETNDIQREQIEFEK